MPARPAPRINTDAPFGVPCKSMGPRYGESAAMPSVLIAWYIVAPPAVTPIMRNRSRRLNSGVGDVLCIETPVIYEERTVQGGRGPVSSYHMCTGATRAAPASPRDRG